MAVKENQRNLLAEIKDEFKFSKNIETDINENIGHGRIETRKCSVISEFQFINNDNDKWKNLSQIIKIESLREFKNSNKPPEKATRYYISSLNNSAEQYQKKYTFSLGELKINYIGFWM